MLPSADHRPWPLPSRPWVMRMTWVDLLFMHWPVDARALAAHVPASLPVDTFGGQAWLGVVPFMMTRTRLRGLPPIPGLSRFPELNVRTYVTVNGRPGVYFFSLDTSLRPAVPAARGIYGLPYYHAGMSFESQGAGWIRLRCDRTDRRSPPATFDARYRPTGDVGYARPGSLDHFLTERYALYAADRRGRPWRGDIHHAPWPLQPAECEAAVIDMTRLIDLPLPDVPPLLHFSRRQDVVAWWPTSA